MFFGFIPGRLGSCCAHSGAPSGSLGSFWRALRVVGFIRFRRVHSGRLVALIRVRWVHLGEPLRSLGSFRRSCGRRVLSCSLS